MESERHQFLFHYTTREVAFEHIIPEGRIRLSSYELMGDPLEAKDWQFGAAYFAGSTAHEDFERNFWRSNHLANELKRHSKLLALSEDAQEGYGNDRESFGRGWARARMWERYAERHKGVCLAFHARAICERLTEALRAQGAERVLHDRVRYEEDGLAGAVGATTFNLNEFEDGRLEDGLKSHFDRHGRDLFFLKTSEWETEHEYRVVGLTDSADFTFADYSDSLAQVIVGDQFPAFEIPGVLEICEAIGVKPRQIRWENFRPWNVDLSPLGSKTRLRENLDRYRAGVRASGDESIPPFRSLPG